jgi:hypothetical protein
MGHTHEQIRNEDLLMKRFLAFIVLIFAFAVGELYLVGRLATTSPVTCGSGDCLSALLHVDSGLKPDQSAVQQPGGDAGHGLGSNPAGEAGN